MTTIKLIPSKLSGSVSVPSSKSVGHRSIICAGLSYGVAVVDNIAISEDIKATNRCLQALGVQVDEVKSQREGRSAFLYTTGDKLRVAEKKVDCGESGSTLRFFIPLGALCNDTITFTGRGKLVSRPLKPYYDIFDKQSLSYFTGEGGQLPLSIRGRLRPGTYTLPGDVSSQFISGLLFALPLLEGDSTLEILPPFESESYVNLTIDSLHKFGVRIERRNNHKYFISGRQAYRGANTVTQVEGDWSQAAFWMVAGTISDKICCNSLNGASLQGDMVIKDIICKMGGHIAAKGHTLGELLEDGSVVDVDNNQFEVLPSETKGITIDAADCPDLVPVLTVLAAVSRGDTYIINAERLRIKECDRLAAISTELNRLGADIEELKDGLIIHGRPEGLKGGAVVDAWNDHRIAMSLAVASCVCREPITLTGSESVSKSYPEFWKDFLSLGGRILE